MASSIPIRLDLNKLDQNYRAAFQEVINKKEKICNHRVVGFQDISLIESEGKVSTRHEVRLVYGLTRDWWDLDLLINFFDACFKEMLFLFAELEKLTSDPTFGMASEMMDLLRDLCLPLYLVADLRDMAQGTFFNKNRMVTTTARLIAFTFFMLATLHLLGRWFSTLPWTQNAFYQDRILKIGKILLWGSLTVDALWTHLLMNLVEWQKVEKEYGADSKVAQEIERKIWAGTKRFSHRSVSCLLALMTTGILPMAGTLQHLMNGVGIVSGILSIHCFIAPKILSPKQIEIRPEVRRKINVPLSGTNNQKDGFLPL